MLKSENAPTRFSHGKIQPCFQLWKDAILSREGSVHRDYVSSYTSLVTVLIWNVLCISITTT
jgi:hypothetical protein